MTGASAANGARADRENAPDYRPGPTIFTTAFHAGNKARAGDLIAQVGEPVMRPEREFLLEQATACRQLALIANGEEAERLRKLAAEYEALALPVLGVAGAGNSKDRSSIN